jgi:hypothetical protein
VTGQAGWYDVRVRIRPAQPEAGESAGTLPRASTPHRVDAAAPEAPATYIDIRYP